MPNLIKFVLVLALSFALAGCAWNKGSDKLQNNVVPQSPKTVSCDDLSTEKQTECETAVKNVVLDMLEKEIMENFDSARCSELQEENRVKCFSIISATGIKGPITAEEKVSLSKALETSDLTICDAMTTEGLITYCKGRIQEQLDEMKVREEAEKGADCAAIEDADQQKYCFYIQSQSK
ncbi:hypothetical protein JXA05_02540 [Candidatus Peregrinibacteria bacterium]|nr:hypothetical protein [Candidatus Peregrinibacteria bacterium]